MFKKLWKSLLCLGLFVTLSPNLTYSNELDPYEQFIESFVYTIDDEIVDAELIKPLKDIQGEESFLLYKINETGYSVIAKNNMNISELYVSSHMEDSYFNDKNYYISPGVFYTDEEYSSFLIAPASVSSNDESNSVSDLIDIQNELTEAELNIEYLPSIQPLASVVLTKPSELSGAAEYGIADSRMTPYKNNEWRNSTNYGYDYQYLGQGICGTISTSVALSYLDRYINSNMIVNAPYSFGNPKFAEWLILFLKNVIEPPLPGAFADDIVYGINSFRGTAYCGLSGSTLAPQTTSSQSVYTSNIRAGYPIILYLNGGASQGNPYGYHWVAAYRYSSLGSTIWFKVADNWGNLAWVNRIWASSGVYFSH